MSDRISSLPGVSAASLEDPAPLDRDPKISRAKKRWQRAVEWEGTARDRFVDDLRFRHGDSDNGWQWPHGILRTRDRLDKPCLTMNIIRQHNLQISNTELMQRSAMEVKPTGNGATVESAIMLNHLLARIEDQSGAQQIYANGRGFQIDGGVGYWRLVTDYLPGDTFEQDFFLRPVVDPLSVYMDPDTTCQHGGDANWAFLFDRMPREEFREAYPDFQGLLTGSALGGTGTTPWMTDDYVQISEYYERVPKKHELLSFQHPGTGGRVMARASMLPENVLEVVRGHKHTKTRMVEGFEVQWTLFVGEEIADETVWPGQFIPIIRCEGERTVIDGVMDRKGHTRALKDAQRMYNYNASAQVEHVALQSKIPYTAPAKSIEGFENLWATANTEDHAVLAWNHVDDDGNSIPEPKRQAAPMASQAFEQGMNTAFQQMKMVSGQWENQMGQPGNERTGAAIDGRKEQGDVATYHFKYNFQDSQIWTAKVILDAMPQVYDTKRVMTYMGNDGVEREVEVNPAARQAYLEERGHDEEVAKRVLNPAIGRYEVKAALGNTATQREQTVKAITLLLTQSPELVKVLGDILLKNMDIPGAQEAAQRLYRMVPPQALGKGPSQAESELQQKVNLLQANLAKTLQQTAKDQLLLAGKAQMRDIDVYKAKTDRLKAMADQLAIDPQDLLAAVQQLLQQGEGDDQALEGIESENKDFTGGADGQGQQSPDPAASGAPDPSGVPGARQAPDGQWYAPDPGRPGSWVRLDPPDAPQAPMPGGPSQ